ncbi:hypothetical protein ACFX1X_023350 [Malus domestica]
MLDEDIVKFGLLSSFKIALEPLSEEPSLKSGNNETAFSTPFVLLKLLKLSPLHVSGTEDPSKRYNATVQSHTMQTSFPVQIKPQHSAH